MTIEPGILSVGFTAYFAVTFVQIWRREPTFGAAYLFLFIYTIFTQIGYAYFPELSELFNAYFGPAVFYDYFIFVFLSFITFYVSFILLRKYFVRRNLFIVIRRPSATKLFYGLAFLHIILMAVYFIMRYDEIDYLSAHDEYFLASQGIPYFIFISSFQYSTYLNFVIYAFTRSQIIDGERLPKIQALLFILEVTLFLSISTKIGDRIDPLSLFTGIIMFEIAAYKKKTTTKSIIKYLAVIVIALCGLTAIESARGPGDENIQGLWAQIIYKDYYSPSHMLIAAMSHHYIDPIEVFLSNLANSAVLMNHPYLQASVEELFNPGVATRYASGAFYIFTEGYMALGWPGFVYNGLVVFFGVALWRCLASSDDPKYNAFMLGLISTQLAGIARGQSSYFIKDIYIIFIPAMFLYFMLSGLRPRLVRISIF